MRKIRTGDVVIVRSGSDRKRQAKVLRVLIKENRAIVEGVRLIKKHVKPNPQKGITGGIITQEAPIHVSNLMLYNPTTQKADRVGIKQLPSGKRIRYFRSNGEEIH